MISIAKNPDGYQDGMLKVLAKLKDRVMVRLAEADLLPIEFTAINRNVNE